MIFLLLFNLLYAADYKIQSDKLIIGRKTDGEKALVFQSNATERPSLSIDASDPDSLLFSQSNFVLGDSLLFRRPSVSVPFLPGINFDGTKLRARNTAGDFWSDIALGPGVTQDQAEMLSQLSVDNRTDEAVSNFTFLWKAGGYDDDLTEYTLGTTITKQASPSNNYVVLVPNNYSVVRLESGANRYPATELVGRPGGNKAYRVVLPQTTGVTVYTSVINYSKGDAFSFGDKVIVNRENLAQDVQAALGAGSITPPPATTPAHSRFIEELSHQASAVNGWPAKLNHPDYSPYKIFRLAAAFWDEDFASESNKNYFNDVSGIDFTVDTSDGGGAVFGTSTDWGGHTSYFTDVLEVDNSTSGRHGGAHLDLTDFEDWYSNIDVITSVGVTEIRPGSSTSNRKNTFTSAKRIRVQVGGEDRPSLLEYNTSSRRLGLSVRANAGTLTLYLNGTAVGGGTSGSSGVRYLNGRRSARDYVWNLPSAISNQTEIAIASSDSSFRMELTNPQNTLRLGDFRSLSGGPMTDDYKRIYGFDFRLVESTGENPLLIVGGQPQRQIFGGIGINKQAMVAYDALGVYVLTGLEDGTNAANKRVTHLRKTSPAAPTGICEVAASGSGGSASINNNCTFRISTPSSGTANLKLYIHFDNTSAGQPPMPITVVDTSVTLGSSGQPSPQGTTVVLPYQKANGGYTYRSFPISFTNTFTSGQNTNDISLVVSSTLDSFLRTNYGSLSLKASIVSERTDQRPGNNNLQKRRIWTALNVGQTHHIIFWLRPDEDQSPDETDPYLTIQGEINGSPFNFPLNRRASEYEFDELRYGVDNFVQNTVNISMSRIQVYKYEFEHNQITNIYEPASSAGMAGDLYDNLNEWLGLWRHPLDGGGSFSISEDFVAPNLEFTVETGFDASRILTSARANMRVEGCAVQSGGGMVSSTICSPWLSSTQRRSTGRYILNIRSDTFSSAPSCTTIGVDSTPIDTCTLEYRPSTSSVGVVCRDFVGGGYSTGARRNTEFDVICIGPR